MELDLIMETEAKKIFNECCKKLGIYENRDRIKDLVIYELTDGTRTSTNLKGWEAYFEGGLFILRVTHILNHLGCKNFYVLTTGIAHRKRDNYKEIMMAVKKVIFEVFRPHSIENGIKLKFIGDIEGISFEGSEFLKSLKSIEMETSQNKGLVVHILIDYSFDWAVKSKEYKKLPNANTIVKHTKGQVNDGLWLPWKLQNNSFVYVQNASMSMNWSDINIIWMICIALRSMLLHEGIQYSKSYSEREAEEIRELREDRLFMVHKRLEPEISKRVIIFSPVGPEIYEY